MVLVVLIGWVPPFSGVHADAAGVDTALDAGSSMLSQAVTEHVGVQNGGVRTTIVVRTPPLG